MEKFLIDQEQPLSQIKIEIEKALIDGEQLLSQIKNFQQSMKIKTDEQPQKKEENTHQDANQDTNKKQTAYDI